MGYKNIEDRKAQSKRYYRANKEKPGKWKDADGNWIKKDPEKRRAQYHKYWLKNRDKINQYQRDRVARLRKEGTCPICLKENQHLYYDHNHTTNLFRDYICKHCNLFLGHAYENLETLQNGINYLKKHNTSSERNQT